MAMEGVQTGPRDKPKEAVTIVKSGEVSWLSSLRSSPS